MSKSSGHVMSVTFMIASTLAVVASLIVLDAPLPVGRLVALIAGWILKAVGSALAIWAIVQLRSGVLGRVTPLLPTVIRTGPYRYTRHPIYLGLCLVLAGIALGLRNWGGLLTVLVLFVPSAVYRATLEDKALRSRFGDEWVRYSREVGFSLPRVFRRE